MSAAPLHDFLARRLNDIDVADEPRIRELLATGEVTLQFTHSGYSREVLRLVDSLCEEFGPQVSVRFYGFSGEVFDASCLELLPYVQRLAVDTIYEVTAVEALFALPRLRELTLGLFDLNRVDLLSQCPLESLETLALCQTRRGELDLVPLARCHALTTLFITGHTRGFGAVAQLRRLQDLHLRSMPPKQDLAALDGLPALEKLRFVLGGRESIAEFGLPRLTELSVVRVRALHNLGDLARFPRLQHLQVEDLTHLKEIDLGRASPELRHLILINCKNLHRIGPVAGLSQLEKLWISRTAVDFSPILASPLPASLKVARLATGKRKLDAPMEQRLAALGYKPR